MRRVVGTLHDTKGTSWALSLYATNAVGATRAAVVPCSWLDAHLRAEEAISARRTSRLTPSTVRSMWAHLDTVTIVIDPVTGRHWCTVLLSLQRVVISGAGAARDGTLASI